MWEESPTHNLVDLYQLLAVKSAHKFRHGVFKYWSMTHITSQGILLVSIVRQNKLDGKEPHLVTIVTTEVLKVDSIWFKYIARISSGKKYMQNVLSCALKSQCQRHLAVARSINMSSVAKACLISPFSKNSKGFLDWTGLRGVKVLQRKSQNSCRQRASICHVTHMRLIWVNSSTSRYRNCGLPLLGHTLSSTNTHSWTPVPQQDQLCLVYPKKYLSSLSFQPARKDIQQLSQTT